MRVDQSYKGKLPAEVELYDDGMCDGPHLEVGHQYLMYTSGTPTEALPARGCTRSRAVEYADEDLQFLRAYEAGKTKTQISGTVRYQPDERDDDLSDQEGKPMKDVAITIAGAGRPYRTKTDGSGRYSISGLPPGTYEIGAELAGYRGDLIRDRLELAARGCVVADALMKVDRRVEGIVHSEDGKPVAGALVEMIPTKPSSKPWESPILLDVSNEKGFYSIDGIPPGEYYVGINIRSTPTKKSPYAPTYYPNTHDRISAIPVTFSVGALVRSYDLTALTKLKVVRVRGRITDALGLPPQNHPEVRISEPVTVDPEGRFEIDLFEGIHYSAFAFSGVAPNMSYSEPIEFTAGDTELHFILNKTGQEFRELRRKLQGH